MDVTAIEGVGFCPPFNGNYTARSVEEVSEEDLEPKTVLKVNPVTGEDMVYNDSSDDESFDPEKADGKVKECKVVETTVVKKVTRDRCILTKPDEDIEQPQTKPLKPFVSSGFAFQEINTIEKTTNVYFVKNKVNCNKPKVVQSSNAAPQCESSSSSGVQKERYVRVYREKRSCFHYGLVGHILKNCSYKNVGKRLEDPKLGRPFVE
ncbi:hypothetical protein L1987_19014 [Smallanthus sonchifolius]|uniref:Uncharacterized protein n=1 Tax=Smallanthus sonchifolius TaxID=185202 RepID=A0ACB9J246_9ASTR|nr:hypothetical protein L1987_19014 [Smallanthus sonchifolius]